MLRLYDSISELVQPFPDEGATQEPIEVIKNAAFLVEEGHIICAGTEAEVHGHPKAAGAQRIDLGHRAVIPGLVDSHTHIVFAGDRVDEMARRSRGETYEQIAAAGGGIVRSVAALRDASDESLERQSAARLHTLISRGTTTVEIKTGYGLDPQLESKQLRAIAHLKASTPATVMATILAHVIPKNRRHEPEVYIDEFCREVLEPAARQGIAQFCDVFVEAGAFDAAQARRIATRAQAMGLGIKLHVDQLRDGDGAQLAADIGALSADHLEYTSLQGRRALAEAGVVATVLPGCKLFLGKGPWPAGRELRDAGCEVAIATDCNPGSSNVADLPLCGTMATTLCGLTFEEALWGMTRGGAKALGLTDRGCLRDGERADFVVLDAPDWRFVFYQPANTPIAQVVAEGQVVFGAEF